MWGALIGAAVAIGTTIYNSAASSSDKRKARKELRSLANRYGVSYKELNSILYDYYKKNANYEDVSNDIEALITSKGNETQQALQQAPQQYGGYTKTREETYNDYIDALKDIAGNNVSDIAFDDSIKKNQNVYSTAMDEFEAERKADYQTYQEKINQYKDFLNNALNTIKSKGNNLTTLQDYNNKYNNNMIATLANLQSAGMQTQNNLLSQAMGI